MPAELIPDAADMARLEEAADWLDRFDELTPAEQAAFEAWLKASEANARAFARMAGTMEDPALAEAAARVEPVHAEATVVPIRSGLSRRDGRVQPLSVWGPAVGMAAAAAVAGLVLTGQLQRAPRPVPAAAPKPVEYATGVGRRQDATLSDRSVLHMDADSAVRVAFSDSSRELLLERGEAMFDVTHDPARPFDVSAGGAAVTAVGTLFDVDLLSDTVEVRVFRGVVKVRSADGATRFLRAGEWMSLNGSHEVAGRFTPDLAQTWRSNWLRADDMPLKDVVARLNRYSSKAIVLKSGGLSEAALTGRFDLSRTHAAVEMISRLENLKVEQDARNIYLSRR